MSTLSKATYRFDAIPIKISMAFFLFAEIGKNSKVESRILILSHIWVAFFFSILRKSSQIKEYLGSHLEVSIN